MRWIAIILSLLLVLTAAAQTTPPSPPQSAVQSTTDPVVALTGEQLLQRGREHYRAGRWAEAASDLRAASAALLSPEEKQKYIDSGKLETLPQVEQSLVYLALAYSRLGKDAEARDAIMRLANAERIAPTFASLPLDAETADFPALVSRIAPAVTLPQNAQLARGSAPATTTVAEATPPAPSPVATAPGPVSTTAQTAAAPAVSTSPAATATPAAPAAPTVAAPLVAQTAPPAAAPATTADRAAILKEVDEKVAKARAEIERDAAAKIAAANRQADERVAAEKAAADKSAQEKIAAERAASAKAADERIAAERAAMQRDAEAKIAAERAAAEKAAQEKIAQAEAQEKAAAEALARAEAEKEVRDRIAAAEAEKERTWLTNLRRAQSFAEAGNAEGANEVYTAVALAPNAPREIIAAAATGLYRTGAYADAVAAFQRLGTFARGEEDLRYYNAVSLFEIGRFAEAKFELSCALPFIQKSEEVRRNQAKIEGMPAR